MESEISQANLFKDASHNLPGFSHPLSFFKNVVGGGGGGVMRRTLTWFCLKDLYLGS